MLPAKEFLESNKTFGKPSDMTDEQCGSLDVFIGHDSDRLPIIISKWKPTSEELAELEMGGHVYLTIYGTGMPPVALSVENPIIILG